MKHVFRLVIYLDSELIEAIMLQPLPATEGNMLWRTNLSWIYPERVIEEFENNHLSQAITLLQSSGYKVEIIDMGSL